MDTLFKNAMIIDGLGNRPTRGYLEVRGNVINAVGPGEKDGVSEDLEVVDVNGLTILPGLIDCHVHFQYESGPNPRQQMLSDTDPMTALRFARNAEKTLMAGITTVRECGCKNHVDFSFRRAVSESLCPSPRLMLSGIPICTTGGHGWQYGREADGPDQVRKAAREQLKAGADNIKFMATGGIMTEGTEIGAATFNVEEMKAGIEEAKKAGKITAAHAQGAAGIKNAVRAGISSIEHGYLLDEEGIDLILANNVYLVATAAAVRLVIENGLERGVPAHAVRKAQEGFKSHVNSFKKAYKAGVKLAMGTDAGMPYNRHGENLQELPHLVEMGLSPMEALQTATINGSRLLKMDNLIGSLEKGKLADILIVDGNPLEDISLLKDQTLIKAIILNGEFKKNQIREK